jgi:hypothetical protein
VADLHCRSDKYLAGEVWREYQENRKKILWAIHNEFHNISVAIRWWTKEANWMMTDADGRRMICQN